MEAEEDVYSVDLDSHLPSTSNGVRHGNFYYKHYINLYLISAMKRDRVRDQIGEGSRVKRSRLCPTIESDLKGTHIKLTVDFTEDVQQSIITPECLLEEVDRTIAKMGAAKVQFGVLTEYEKDGEVKTWHVSLDAKVWGPDFVKDGIDELNARLETHAQLGSSWNLLRILEVYMAITKISNIIHRSGKFYYIYLFIITF